MRTLRSGRVISPLISLGDHHDGEAGMPQVSRIDGTWIHQGREPWHRPRKQVGEGPPEKSFWTGTKTRGKKQVQVLTYRCSSCGYLESYAS